MNRCWFRWSNSGPPPLHTSNSLLLSDTFGWDTATWSRCLSFWDEHTSITPPADALEVGATGNNGGLSTWLAHQGFSVVWSGLEKPEPRARHVHFAHGVEDRISYETIDVLQIPYHQRFDVIVFKSLLGVFGMGSGDASNAQRAALVQMHQALKPGGELWWVENAEGSPVHAFLRGRFGWRRFGWQYLHLNSVPLLFSGFERIEYTTFGVSSVLGRTERQKRLLAVLDRAVLERITPASWHYVVAGVARKSVCGE